MPNTTLLKNRENLVKLLQTKGYEVDAPTLNKKLEDPNYSSTLWSTLIADKDASGDLLKLTPDLKTFKSYVTEEPAPANQGGPKKNNQVPTNQASQQPASTQGLDLGGLESAYNKSNSEFTQAEANYNVSKKGTVVNYYAGAHGGELPMYRTQKEKDESIAQSQQKFNENQTKHQAVLNQFDENPVLKGLMEDATKNISQFKTTNPNGLTSIDRSKLRDYANNYYKKNNIKVDPNGDFANTIHAKLLNNLNTEIVKPDIQNAFNTKFKKQFGKDFQTYIQDQSTTALEAQAAPIHTKYATESEKIKAQFQTQKQGLDQGYKQSQSDIDAKYSDPKYLADLEANRPEGTGPKTFVEEQYKKDSQAAYELYVKNHSSMAATQRQMSARYKSAYGGALQSVYDQFKKSGYTPTGDVSKAINSMYQQSATEVFDKRDKNSRIISDLNNNLTPGQNQLFGRAAVAGTTNLLANLSTWMGNRLGYEWSTKLKDQAQDLAEYTAIPANPLKSFGDLLDPSKVIQNIGEQLPNIGASIGLSLLARRPILLAGGSQLAATIGGGVLATIQENLGRQGQVEQQLLDQGTDLSTAKNKSKQVWDSTIPSIAFNTIQLEAMFGKFGKGSLLSRFGANTGAELLTETPQEILQTREEESATGVPEAGRASVKDIFLNVAPSVIAMGLPGSARASVLNNESIAPEWVTKLATAPINKMAEQITKTSLGSMKGAVDFAGFNGLINPEKQLELETMLDNINTHVEQAKGNGLNKRQQSAYVTLVSTAEHLQNQADQLKANGGTEEEIKALEEKHSTASEAAKNLLANKSGNYAIVATEDGDSHVVTHDELRDLMQDETFRNEVKSGATSVDLKTGRKSTSPANDLFRDLYSLKKNFDQNQASYDGESAALKALRQKLGIVDQNLPTEFATVTGLIGHQVEYNDGTTTMTGELKQDGQTLVVENDKTIRELGNVNEFKGVKPKDVNLKYITPENAGPTFETKKAADMNLPGLVSLYAGKINPQTLLDTLMMVAPDADKNILATQIVTYDNAHRQTNRRVEQAQETDQDRRSPSKISAQVAEEGTEYSGQDVAETIVEIGDKTFSSAFDKMKKFLGFNFIGQTIDLDELYRNDPKFAAKVEEQRTTKQDNRVEQSKKIYSNPESAPAVIVNGKVEDGYGRLAQLYINGEKQASAFVSTGKADVTNNTQDQTGNLQGNQENDINSLINEVFGSPITSEELNTQAVNARQILQAMVPDAEVVVHTDPASYSAAVVPLGGRAQTGGNAAFRTNKDGKTEVYRIDINASSANSRTVSHELAHAVLLNGFGINEGLFNQFKNQVSQILSGEDAQALNNFTKTYKDSVRAEEFLAELSGALRAGEVSPTLLSKIAQIINDFVKAITLGNFTPFEDVQKANDVIDMLTSLAPVTNNGTTSGQQGSRSQAEGLFTGTEQVPVFKNLTEAAKWLGNWSKKNKVFASEAAKLSDKKFVDKLEEHTIKELEAWGSVRGDNYVGFYEEDIPNKLNPELQAFAEKRYGRKLTNQEVILYHMVSGFASPNADPIFDSSKGLEVFDKYMKTGELSAYSDKQATVWEMGQDGKKFDTGKLKFDSEGGKVMSQVSPKYATASLNKFKNVIDYFKGDLEKAVNWATSTHTYQEISDVMGTPVKGPKALDAHENLSKDAGGFGVFGFTGAKLGSYILNRIGEHSTVTKDMWYARTMARLTGESLIEDGKALVSPWGLTIEGVRKRKLADKAWGNVADKLNITMSAVQQQMWDFEKRLYEKLGTVEKSGYASEGFLKKAKELEPGIDFSGSRSQEYSTQMVSPNEMEGTALDDSIAKLGTPEMASYMKAMGSIDKMFGFAPDTNEAVGVWSDGAEQSSVARFKENIDFDTLKAMGAVKGLMSNQKAVLNFKADEIQDIPDDLVIGEGKGFLFEFAMPGDVKTVTKSLTDAGLEFKTVVPVGNSDTMIYLYTDENETFDKYTKFVTDNNIQHEHNYGQGEFTGTWGEREEAYDVYNGAIERYVNKAEASAQWIGDLKKESTESIADYRSRAAKIISERSGEEVTYGSRSQEQNEKLNSTEGFKSRSQILGASGAERLSNARKVIDNKNTAIDMELAGEDALTVRLATGWERGADGLWRIEISDGKLKKFKVEDLPKNNRGFHAAKLSDIYNNPKLFKAYDTKESIKKSKDGWASTRFFKSSIGDVEVEFNPYLPEGEGSFDQNENKIELASQTKEHLPTLLHEIQHYVQLREGFEIGSNQMTVGWDIDRKFDRLKEDVQEAEQNLYNANLWSSDNKEFVASKELKLKQAKDKITELVNSINGKNKTNSNGTSDFELYRKLAAETEARNVEYRMGLTPDERRSKLLSSSEDVSREDQILLMDDLQSPTFDDSSRSQQPISKVDKFITAARNRGFSEQTIATALQSKLGMSAQDAQNALMGNQTNTGQQPTTPPAKAQGKFVSFFKEQLLPFGNIGKEIGLLREQMAGNLSAQMFVAMANVNKVEKLIKASNVSEEDIDEFLRGGTPQNAIPTELADQLSSMRMHIDNLTDQLINMGLVSPEMIATLEANKGQYLTRSYELFNSKDVTIDNITNRLKSVDDQVVNAAMAVLYDEQIKHVRQMYPNASPKEQQDMAMASARTRANTILAQEGSDFKKSGKLGAKDLSFLQSRKDIDPEIRALMGEYTDPIYNYAKTVFKLANTVSAQAFLTEAAKTGLGKIFFQDDVNRPEGATYKIAGDESDVMSPLNGLYTYPEVGKEFETHDAKLNDALTFIFAAAGTVRKYKTVYNPMTHVKNVIGNVGFVIANGHFGELGQTWDFIADWVQGKENQKLFDLATKLHGYGVLNSSIGSNEIRSYFDNSSRIEDNLSTIGNKQGNWWQKTVGKSLKKAGKWAEDMYQKEDDIYKLMAFLNESNRYSKAMYGKTYDQLSDTEMKSIDDKVTDIVKNTYPTFSRTPKFVKTLSKGFFLGNFLSFQVESVRVSYNTLKLANEELQSGNPSLMKLGAMRIAGTAVSASIPTALTYYGSMLAGMGLSGLAGFMAGDDDEKKKKAKEKERATRKFAHPFNKEGDLIVVKAKDGELTYYDVSSSDPRGYPKEVWNAFWNNMNDEKGFAKSAFAATAQSLSPYLDPDMTLKGLTGVLYNQNSFGAEIYDQNETAINKILKIGNHLRKTFQPGVISAVERPLTAGLEGDKEKMGNELAAQATGMRAYKIDVLKKFTRSIYETAPLDDFNPTTGFAGRIKKGESYYRSVANNKKSTVAEKDAAYTEANERVATALKDLKEYYDGAIALGVAPEELNHVLKVARLGKHEMYSIRTGDYNTVYMRQVH